MDTSRRFTLVGLASLVLAARSAAAAAPAPAPGAVDQPAALHSPYASLPGAGATGLLPEEIEGLKKGQGMALALAAEANGYPGPRHVLDMDSAGRLPLTADQRRDFERLYDGMLADAKAKGQEILESEEHLAMRFRHGQIDEATLGATLEEIGRLRAQLRFVHLRTHLTAMSLLTPEQVAHYRTVCGYDAGGGTQHRH